jgi:hypothetical protein
MPRIIGIYIAETNGDASMSRKNIYSAGAGGTRANGDRRSCHWPRGTNRDTGKSGMNIA